MNFWRVGTLACRHGYILLLRTEVGQTVAVHELYSLVCPDIHHLQAGSKCLEVLHQ